MLWFVSAGAGTLWKIIFKNTTLAELEVAVTAVLKSIVYFKFLNIGRNKIVSSLVDIYYACILAGVF
jgi:hypothetical protein